MYSIVVNFLSLLCSAALNEDCVARLRVSNSTTINYENLGLITNANLTQTNSSLFADKLFDVSCDSSHSFVCSFLFFDNFYKINSSTIEKRAPFLLGKRGTKKSAQFYNLLNCQERKICEMKWVSLYSKLQIRN